MLPHGPTASQRRYIDIYDVHNLFPEKRLRERGGKSEIRIPCPVHNGDDDNCVIVQEPGGGLRAYCKSHECSGKTIILTLVERIKGPKPAASSSFHPARADPRQPSRKASDSSQPAVPEGQKVHRRKELSRQHYKCQAADGRTATHTRINYDDESKSFYWKPSGIKATEFLYVKGDEKGDRIVVTEGEKAADAVAKAMPEVRILGTTTGAQSAPDRDTLRAFVGEMVDIVLWPDNDNQGADHMRRIAEALAEIGKEVRKVSVEGIVQKGDAADVITEQVRPRVESAAPWKCDAPSVRPKARPDNLVPLLTNSDPYPVEALGKFSEATSRLHTVIQAPMPMCAGGVLASLALCSQGAFDVGVGGLLLPTSLSILVIAESGAGKTPVEKAVLYAVRKREEEEERQYRKDLKAHRVEVLRRKENDEEPPEAPLPPKYLQSDVTVEALQRRLKIAAHGTIGVFTSEAGRLLAGYSLSGQRMSRGLAVYSDLYDGNEISVERVTEGGSFTLYRRRVSCFWGVQPRVAKRFMTDDVVADQGMLGRFLVAHCDTMPPRTWKTVNLLEEQPIKDLFDAQLALLDKGLGAKQLDEGTDRPILGLEEEALEAWEAAYNGVEERYTNSTTGTAVKAYWGKAAGHVLRIAAVLTVGHAERSISRRRIQDALAIVTWYGGDLSRATEAARVPESAKKAEALRAWLADQSVAGVVKREDGFVTTRLIQQFAPAAIRVSGADGIRTLMAILIRAGYDITTVPDARGWQVGNMILDDADSRYSCYTATNGMEKGAEPATESATPATNGVASVGVVAPCSNACSSLKSAQLKDCSNVAGVAGVGDTNEPTLVSSKPEGSDPGHENQCERCGERGHPLRTYPRDDRRPGHVCKDWKACEARQKLC